ncbi:aminotransferase class III-fold pyridoxal phosphate-dependent enzyme [Candidatus Woesearchaeota archaeon]|nr:aminotransferase class III-fold pyridoxal phosphate-dependent enzyme [Candidatus Woesearchaeota archaeon]
MKPRIKTSLPGPGSEIIIKKIRKLNIAYSDPYPYVHSKKGNGCYFQDIDGNIFLDFASQIASNPLGYNNKGLNKVIKSYKKHPVKYAGQDFNVKEHADLLEELMTIVPKNLNQAFLINSGAEAVENCIKLAMRKQKKAKFGISFQNDFHGRTLGALSYTHSKPIQKLNYFTVPNKTLPFSEDAIEKFKKIIKQNSTSSIAFVLMETIQGEGGYNVAPEKLVKDIRKITKQYGIPLILDEVQSGMGRTGKWWAHQHFNIQPDLMSSAKALQVGATVASKKFSVESGSISSTWGGGHTLDLALGLKTIEIIKKKKLLNHISNVGNYLKNNLEDLNFENVRGKGLMLAFDLKNKDTRNNFIIEALKNGLVLLGCGQKGIRVIPPYIVSEKEVDQALEIFESVNKKINKPGFKHTGKICNYLTCGESHT